MQPEPWLAVGLVLAWSAGLLFVVLCDGWAEGEVAVLAAVVAEDDVATTGAGGGAAVVGAGATGTAVVGGGGGGGGAGTDETCEL
jgi:hypothetical protein